MTATSHVAHDARLPFAGGGTPSPLPATTDAVSTVAPLAGDSLAHDHSTSDTQRPLVVGEPSPLPATFAATPITDPLAGDSLAHDQIGFDAQGSRIVGDPLSDKDHPEPSHDALAGDPFAHDHKPRDAQNMLVVGDPSPPPASAAATPNNCPLAGGQL